LNVVSAREGMVLIWAPNSEEDVVGYNIYRSTTPGQDYTKINKELVRETTFTDKDIKQGQKYYYVITAVDSAPVPNESEKSAETSEVARKQ
jgi:fibronectin type 3 domain-containing protein